MGESRGVAGSLDTWVLCLQQRRLGPSCPTPKSFCSQIPGISWGEPERAPPLHGNPRAWERRPGRLISLGPAWDQALAHSAEHDPLTHKGPSRPVPPSALTNHHPLPEKPGNEPRHLGSHLQSLHPRAGREPRTLRFSPSCENRVPLRSLPLHPPTKQEPPVPSQEPLVLSQSWDSRHLCSLMSPHIKARCLASQPCCSHSLAPTAFPELERTRASRPLTHEAGILHGFCTPVRCHEVPKG